LTDSEEGTGRGHSPLRPLLAVPNATAHPSVAIIAFGLRIILVMSEWTV